jgi:hypothetical protein
MFKILSTRGVATLTLCGAVFVGILLLKPPPSPASSVATATSTHVPGIVAAIASTVFDPAARIEIESQADTALTVKFYDAANALYTMDFTRPTTNDAWRASTTASPGILFGNTEPRYAGSAVRRALGITAEQAITTFNTSIVNRPMEDVTIFKTFSGTAIALWQEDAITEIHYVGSWVQDVVDYAQQTGTPMCDASLAQCCNSATGFQWPPGLDSCAAALQCTAMHKAEACSCLQQACAHCPHPADPEAPNACNPVDQEISNDACDMGGPPCEVTPPVQPITLQDIWNLLKEILERLQQWFDGQLEG